MITDNNDSNTSLGIFPSIIDIHTVQENLAKYRSSSLDPELNYIDTLKKINSNEIDPPKFNPEESNSHNLLNYIPIIKYENEKENQIEKKDYYKILNSSNTLPSSFSTTIRKKKYKNIFKTKNLKKKNKDKNKENNILIPTKRKRGRKTNNIKEVNSHTANDYDNLLIKIHSDFLNFIISLANDALLTEFGKNYHYNFKKISYSLKKKINYGELEKYKSFSIKQIIGLDISQKYKINDNKINEKLLEKVCNLSSWLNSFFNLKYLNFFEYYYNNREPINKIQFQNKNIILSDNTRFKSFNNLLLKYKELNSNLIRIVNKLFVSGFNENNNKNRFLIFEIQNLNY